MGEVVRSYSGKDIKPKLTREGEAFSSSLPLVTVTKYNIYCRLSKPISMLCYRDHLFESMHAQFHS